MTVRSFAVLAAALGLSGLICTGVLWTQAQPKYAVLATVEDDPTLPSITLDGITFHAESYGDPANPTVVVLHGGPGGDYRNLLVLAELADDYHVVFYDQRGTGLSPRVAAEELTFATSLEDVHRVVTHAGGGAPVALIGHSWGAMLAAYYLAQHPEMVARAVLAEPGVLTSEELQQFVVQIQPSLSISTALHMGRTALEMSHISGPDDDAGKDYMVAQLMTAPGDDNPMNGYWCNQHPPAAAHEIWRVGSTSMQAILEQAEGDDGLLHLPTLDASAYAGEVLLVASECNTLIGVDRQTRHMDLFVNARLETIAGAGHLMFTDKPMESQALLRAYLAEWPRTDLAEQPLP